MTEPLLKRPNRYPGASPFSPEQEQLFFGRADDINNLYNLVIRVQITLLYAKSGLGKSSLIQAGLLPEILKKTKIVPIQVRFGNYIKDKSVTPLENIIESLPAANAPAWLNQYKANKHLLWWHLKALQITAPGTIYLLIFDQFEELFTYPKDQVAVVKSQLAIALSAGIPENLWFSYQAGNILQDVKTESIEEQLDILELRNNTKLLIAIREDRYSYLNLIADELPEIMHNKYTLKPLSFEQAEKAIREPALVEGAFDTPTFKFTDEAVEKIMKFLTNNIDHKPTQPVETTQLQILCNKLEKLGKPVINEHDIPDFDNIFLNFYTETLEKVPAAEQQGVKLLIEDQMINQGRRVSLDRLSITNISAETLNILVQEHLIREEPNTVGGTSFELAHDTLVGPVNIAKRERQVQESIRANIEIKRKLVKAQRGLWLTISLLVISIASVIFAVLFALKARDAKLRADRETVNALRAEATAVENEKKIQATLNNYYYSQIREKGLEKKALQLDINSYMKSPPIKPIGKIVEEARIKMELLDRQIDSLQHLIK